MSDSPVAIRAIALAEAIRFISTFKETVGLATVLHAANAFDSFLNSTNEVVTGETEPTKTAVAKATKAATKVAKVEAAVEKAVAKVEGPNKADVGSVVEKLLGADKRTEAVALMKTFGASSVSTLAETKYAEFIEAAEAILMTA